MNKKLSLAIERAVEKISPMENFSIQKVDKKPDLFSLTSQNSRDYNATGCI